jgi:hypothetical protein
MVMKAMRVEFKVSEEAERLGMDEVEMGESAYHHTTGKESVYSLSMVKGGSQAAGIDVDKGSPVSNVDVPIAATVV